MFSFSIFNCYAITPRSVSYQYTIDQILSNGTVGYNTDTYYDNSFNIITYLSWLKTDDGHACSTVSSKYCTILNYYNSFMDSYVDIGDSYNYYVLTDLGSSRFNIYYILTNGEIYYQTDGANHWLKIDSGDIRYFVYNGAFESPTGRIVPWNSSNYVDNNPYFSIGGTSSNILLANIDVKDSNGNIIFEGNIDIEEPEPEGGSDGLVLDTLKDFLRWAILPSDDFFSAWKEEQLNKIDSLDNVLTYPFSLLVRFGDTVFNLDEEKDPKICWSDIDFNVKEENYHLLDQGCFRFNSILETEKLNELYGIYLLFVKFVLISMFVSLCIRKWNSIFNKGG